MVMGPAALDRYKWRYHSGCGAGLGFCLGLRLGLGVGLGDSLGLNFVPPELRRCLLGCRRLITQLERLNLGDLGGVLGFGLITSLLVFIEMFGSRPGE